MDITNKSLSALNSTLLILLLGDKRAMDTKIKAMYIYEGWLIKPKSDLLPDVVGRNRHCRWKEGPVHVPNCLSLLQRLKGSMSGDARYFNNIETRADIKLFFFLLPLQGKAPKEIQAILIEILGEYAHRMPPSKTGWPSLNVVIFPPEMRLVLDDPKQ